MFFLPNGEPNLFESGHMSCSPPICVQNWQFWAVLRSTLCIKREIIQYIWPCCPLIRKCRLYFLWACYFAGIERNETQHIQRQYSPLSLTFNRDQRQFYKPGLPYNGKVRLLLLSFYETLHTRVNKNNSYSQLWHSIKSQRNKIDFLCFLYT